MKFFGGVGRGSSVAAWLSLTGALHGCVYNRTAATIQEKDTRK